MSREKQQKYCLAPCKCQQASETTSNFRLGTSSYTNVRSTTISCQTGCNLQMNGSQTYANPDKYYDNANTTKGRCLGRQL